jgi:SAM-dependent methyltransferase
VKALDRWRRELADWAIPREILDAAPESPYGFPVAPFRARGEARGGGDPTPTTLLALTSLPEGGRVLDVGCGGGATSLPLAGRAGVVVGLDAQEDMLEGFQENARAAGVAAETVHGRWPDAARRVQPVDLAVAGHVLYNVGALEPFVRALTTTARRRVVIEITERHPLHWMNDLWLRFHGIERPEGPAADDAIAAVAELGFEPEVERWAAAPGRGGFERRSDALALVRRRLCLNPSRDRELEEALGDRLAETDGLWGAGPPGTRSLVAIALDPQIDP